MSHRSSGRQCSVVGQKEDSSIFYEGQKGSVSGVEVGWVREMEHTDTETLLGVYLKFRCDQCPVFLFAQSGSPEQRGILAGTKLRLFFGGSRSLGPREWEEPLKATCHRGWAEDRGLLGTSRDSREGQPALAPRGG